MFYLITNSCIELTCQKRTETGLTHVDHNQCDPLPFTITYTDVLISVVAQALYDFKASTILVYII